VSAALARIAPPVRISFAQIASRLAKRCMYHGATQAFYSEAQHAVILASEAARTDGAVAGLYGLLHQAHLALPDHAGACPAALHEAIDLDWPAPKNIERLLTMLQASLELAEMQQFLVGWEAQIAARLRAGVRPMRRLLKPLSCDRAQDQFTGQMRAYATQAGLGAWPSLAGIL
jgi:hypothetical protein